MGRHLANSNLKKQCKNYQLVRSKMSFEIFWEDETTTGGWSRQSSSDILVRKIQRVGT